MGVAVFHFLKWFDPVLLILPCKDSRPRVRPQSAHSNSRAPYCGHKKFMKMVEIEAQQPGKGYHSVQNDGPYVGPYEKKIEIEHVIFAKLNAFLFTKQCLIRNPPHIERQGEVGGALLSPTCWPCYNSNKAAVW